MIRGWVRVRIWDRVRVRFGVDLGFRVRLSLDKYTLLRL